MRIGRRLMRVLAEVGSSVQERYDSRLECFQRDMTYLRVWKRLTNMFAEESKPVQCAGSI